MTRLLAGCKSPVPPSRVVDTQDTNGTVFQSLVVFLALLGQIEHNVGELQPCGCNRHRALVIRFDKLPGLVEHAPECGNLLGSKCGLGYQLLCLHPSPPSLHRPSEPVPATRVRLSSSTLLQEDT